MGVAVFDKLLDDLTNNQVKRIFFSLLKMKIFTMVICIVLSLLGTDERPD